MSIEFDLGTNSAGRSLGSALQSGLNNDLSKLLKGTTAGKISQVITGSGSTEEKIVGSISSVISGASITSIGNDLNTVRQMANDYTDVDSITNAAMDVVEGQINALMSDSGAMDAIQEVLDVTNDFINLLQKALAVAMYGGQVLNVASLVGTSTSTTCIPTVKECLLKSAANLKATLTELWKDLRQQLIDMQNLLICTNCDAVIDNVMISVDRILDYLSTYLDPVMEQYTHHTLSEARYYTALGFQMIKMLLRVSQNAKKKKQQKAEEDANAAKEAAANAINSAVDKAKDTVKDEVNKIKLAGAEIADNAKDTGNEIVDNAKNVGNSISSAGLDAGNAIKSAGLEMANDISNTGKELGNTIASNAKEKFKNYQEDLSEEKIKEELLKWASEQSVILMNAFHLFVIKDLVKLILEKCENIGNMSIENFADFTNGIKEILDLFELFGFYPGAKGLTFLDLKDIGLALARSPKGVVTEVEALADSAISKGTSLANSAANSGTGLMKLAISSGENAADSAIGSGTALVNKGVQTAKNTVSSALDAASETVSQAKNISSDLVSAASVSKTVNSNVDKAGNIVNDTVNAGAGLVNEATASAAGVATNVTGAASGLANSAADTIASTANNALDEAISLMDGISMSALLDMSEVESIISGKVMMFDIVVQFFNILQPIIELLVFICHLLENYILNKQTVENHANMNLNAAVAKIADIAMGLKGLIDGSNCNFYTVRTKEMNDWCMSNLDCNIGKDQIAKVGIPDTNKLIAHLNVKSLSWNAAKDLSPLKLTAIYFDKHAIGDEDQKFQDGTLDGLDNIMIDESGNVYYDPEDRSTISSLILRAMKRGEHVGYNNDVEEENDEFSLDDITVVTDEFEGQLVISIPDMNLCQPSEIIEIEDPIIDSSLPYAIIEFADTYTLGEKVEYTINVLPGQNVDLNTTLATILKDGKIYPVKSKFKKGYVLATDQNNGDYFRVYPYSCDRHIVIADYEEGTTIDVSDALKIGDKFGDATKVAANIISYLPYSTLPIILNNADRTTVLVDTVDTYKNAIDDYLEFVNQLSKEMQEGPEISADALKQTKGDPTAIKGIADKIIEKREQLIEKSIKTYKDALVSKAYGSHDYVDCTNLALTNLTGYKFQITSTEDFYQNYYMSLYSMIMMDETLEDKMLVQYKSLLENIIDRRLETEKYDVYQLMVEFNKLFNLIINNKNILSNQYEILFNLNKQQKMKYDEVETYVKHQYINAHVSAQDKQLLNIYTINKDEAAIDQWWKLLESEYKGINQIIKRICNIFFYIYNHSTNVPVKLKMAGKTKDEIYKDAKEVAGEIFRTYLYNGLSNDAISLIMAKCWKSADESEKVIGLIKVEYTKSERIDLYIDNLKKIVKKSYNQSNISDTIDLYKEYLYDISGLLYHKEKQLINGYSINNGTITFIDNRMAFILVQKESQELLEFWDEIITKYYNEYKLDVLISELTTYGENAAMGRWPEEQDVEIGRKLFQLYLFDNSKTSDPEIPEMNIPDPIPAAGWDEEVDYDQDAEIKEPDKNEVRSDGYMYWLIYMANATLLTLIPGYWADGFDVPPAMTPVLLPAIYVPICPPITIPMINVTMVLGIAIRGIWIAPIILLINNNQSDLDASFPVMIALDMTKKYYKMATDYIEQGVGLAMEAAATTIIGNEDMQKKLYEKFRLYASLIRAIPVEDKEAIEKEFYEALFDGDAKSTHDAAIKKVSDKMLDSLQKTTTAIANGYSALNVKIENSKKSAMDKRQIVTRLDKLGTGQEPF